MVGDCELVGELVGDEVKDAEGVGVAVGVEVNDGLGVALGEGEPIAVRVVGCTYEEALAAPHEAAVGVVGAQLAEVAPAYTQAWPGRRPVHAPTGQPVVTEKLAKPPRPSCM